MNTQIKLFKKIMLLGLFIMTLACSKEDGPDIIDPTNPSLGSVEDVIANGDPFQSFPPTTTASNVGAATTKNEKYDRKDGNGQTINQRWVCTEQEVDITGGSHTFPLYNTNASVIWPGNLLQGKTLDNATPSDIVVKRAGGQISYNLVTGNPQATRKVDVVDQGSIQQAMNDVIRDNGDITPANFTLDIEAINSKEELALEMGLTVSTLASKVSSSFSYNSSDSISSVLVKLTQQYYTMSYTKPTSLDEVFDPSVTPEQLARFVQKDNPATFISSVTYGRVFYMLYESTASAQDMKATLNGSYNAVAGSAQGSADIETLREYNNLNVKVIAYGGDSEGTLNAVGATFGGDDVVDNLKDIVDRLAKSSDIAGGLPLSYVVNSLEDPSQVVSTNLATRYTIKNCELKGLLPPETYLKLVDLFDDGIGAATQVSQTNVVVYNSAGTKYAWFNATSGDVSKIFDIKDPDGPMGVTSFSAIGAAVHFNDDQIYIFDDSGLNTEILDYPSDQFTANSVPTKPIGTYKKDGDVNKVFPVNLIFADANNFQFAGEAFEAGCRFYTSTNDSPPKPIMHFFRKPGDLYADYRPTGSNGAWLDPIDVNNWGGTNNQPYFERIGAACRIQFGANNVRQLFFNDTGDEFIIWNPNADIKDRFSSPWVIN